MAILNLPDGIRVAGSSPIDADRYHQPTISGRDALVSTGRAEVGQQVYVDEDETLYILKDATGTGTWESVGTGSSGGSYTPIFTGGYQWVSEGSVGIPPNLDLDPGTIKWDDTEFLDNEFNAMLISNLDSLGTDRTAFLSSLTSVTPVYVFQDDNTMNYMEIKVNSVDVPAPGLIFISFSEKTSFTLSSPVNTKSLTVGAILTNPIDPNAPGLATLDEGNGIGWRLYGRNANLYSPIGLNAVDISTSTGGPDKGASGPYSFSSGKDTFSFGESSHSEGEYTIAIGRSSHVEGGNTEANGIYSHAEGYTTIADGDYSHAEGFFGNASGTGAHSEGTSSYARGYASHAEGTSTQAIGDFSHSEGNLTNANGKGSHVEGQNTNADGDYSHAEGLNTYSGGTGGHSEGYSTYSSGFYSHAEGEQTYSTGGASHSEGTGTYATGYGSHSEGIATKAGGQGSHSEGYTSEAKGSASHSEGYGTIAIGDNSHAEGLSTISLNLGSHSAGKFNIGTSTDTIHETGIGTSDINRKNGFEIYTDGTLTAPVSTIALIDSRGSKALITKEYGDANYSIGITGPTGPAGADGAPGATGTSEDRIDQTVASIGNVSGDVVFDMTKSNIDLNLVGDITSVAFTNNPPSNTRTTSVISMTQDSSARTINWNGSGVVPQYGEGSSNLQPNTIAGSVTQYWLRWNGSAWEIQLVEIGVAI